MYIVFYVGKNCTVLGKGEKKVGGRGGMPAKIAKKLFLTKKILFFISNQPLLQAAC